MANMQTNLTLNLTVGEIDVLLRLLSKTQYHSLREKIDHQATDELVIFHDMIELAEITYDTENEEA